MRANGCSNWAASGKSGFTGWGDVAASEALRDAWKPFSQSGPHTPMPATRSTPSMAETPRSNTKKRNDVYEARSSKKRKVDEADDNSKNLALQPGVRCKLHGLESEVGQTLNGRIGSVERYDHDAARYVIRLEIGTKDVKSFKVENVKILACGSTEARGTGSAPPDDLVGSGSARKQNGRHQWSPEEEKRLLDGFSDLGPHWEQIRCNKNLKHLTGVQLKDKHRNLKKS